MNKAKESPKLPVTRQGLRPGDFPLGSAQSRAAARAQLKNKQEEEEWEATRPPDERIIFGIPRPYQRTKTEVRRYRHAGRIIEEVFPVLEPGESLGWCSVEPTSLTVEEALQYVREERRREREKEAEQSKSQS